MRELRTSVQWAVLWVAAAGLSAQAAVKTSHELKPKLTQLTEQISSSDLINGISATNEGFVNFGEVDGHESCLVGSGDPCLGLPPICNPSEGFLQCGGVCTGDVTDFTDGQAGALGDAILRDFGRAAIIARFDLPQPKDIGEIRVFAANEDPNAVGNGRIFQTYTVEISKNNGASFQQLGPLVTTGNFGSNNAAGNGASLTRVFDDATNVLAAGVTNIRFVMYCVSNTQGLYVDPWQGIANEDSSYKTVCPDVEQQDVDGRRKAVEAPIIKEIDILPPGAPPIQCKNPVFDVVGGGANGQDSDGAVDAQDFGVFQTCITGAGDPAGVFNSLPDVCKCMDVTGPAGAPDKAISQDDFGIFQRCATGPTPATPVNPNCDNLP